MTPAVIFGLAPDAAAQLVASLTAREVQAAQMIARGLRSAAICRELGISPRTLDIHRQNVCRKLGVITSGIPRIWFAAQFAGDGEKEK